MSTLAFKTESAIENQYTVLDQLPIAIFIVDDIGTLQYHNKHAELMLTQTKIGLEQKIVQQQITQLLANFTFQQFTHAVHAINNNLDDTFNLMLQQDSHNYQLKMTKTTHQYGNSIPSNKHYNKHSYYLITLTSLSHSPSLTEEPNTFIQTNETHIRSLKKNFKELKQFARLNAMREISSSIADKLNQPLTAILSYTQAMQRLYQRNASSEELSNAMNRVVINAENAANIIRDIRSELTTNTLHCQIRSINSLIQESIYLTELDHHTSAIELITQYEPENTQLCVDPLQLRQVIFSLLNNAIDAVSTQQTPIPKIIITTKKEATMYVISLSDNGVGFAPEVIKKLFEPFTTTKENGIGIGLSMCHHIIGLHQGSITIKSDTSHSTRVIIQLPLQANNVKL
jgi:C4-dicarboxylate-specific signal transduction histidine kinase